MKTCFEFGICVGLRGRHRPTAQGRHLEDNLRRKMQLILTTCTILLLYIQTCRSASVGDICQFQGKDLVIHRNYKTGETSCCLNRKCSPGEEPVICDRDDPWSTSCRSCPSGTYRAEETNSSDMLHCIAKTQCYRNLSARYEKSKTRDTRCVCNPKLGVCNPSGVTRNPRSCIEKTCPQGFRLMSNCICEPCIKPENKSKLEEKPCDKRNHLCKTKRETSAREISTICPEDNPEFPSNVAAIVLEKKDNVENPLLMSSSSIPHFSSLISSRPSNGGDQQGRNDLASDHQNGGVSSSQLNQGGISWYVVVILVISVGLVVGVIFISVVCFRKSNCASPSRFRSSPSPRSNSTDDTEMGDIKSVDADEMKGVGTGNTELSSLLPPNLNPSRPSETSVTQDRTGTTDDNIDAMRPSDMKKLSMQMPRLVQSLIINEHLWAFLLSNETVTSAMKTDFDKSTMPYSEKVGALVTYLLKRNSHAFATFIAALIFTKQQHLAMALDPALTAEIKQKYAGDDELMQYAHDLVQSNEDVACISTSHS